MPNKRKLVKWIVGMPFLVLVLIGTGCSTTTIPQYNARPAKQARTMESQGLVITVDPILDSQRADTYFKVNPDSRGLAIIYLQAENRSTNAAWLLNEKNMCLVVPSHAGGLNANDQFVEGDYVTADALSATALPFILFPGIDLIAIPFIISGGNATSDASVIQKNFVDKEWHNQTLSPGQRADGFIYFNLEKHSRWASSATLRMDCFDVRSQQTNTLTFPITYETK